MEASKKKKIEETTKTLMELPEHKRNYILGVMNGIMISFKLDEEKEQKMQEV